VGAGRSVDPALLGECTPGLGTCSAQLPTDPSSPDPSSWQVTMLYEPDRAHWRHLAHKQRTPVYGWVLDEAAGTFMAFPSTHTGAGAGGAARAVPCLRCAIQQGPSSSECWPAHGIIKIALMSFLEAFTPPCTASAPLSALGPSPPPTRPTPPPAALQPLRWRATSWT
jgi:hypothetical protein